MNRDLILHARALATSATVLATKHPPAASVDPYAVEKILATLPEKARLGRLRDAAATAFLFAAWDPQDATACHLHAAVAAQLQEGGLRVDVITEPWGRYAVPRALFVDYESLEQAADAIRFHQEDWLLGARAEWAARFGDAGAVEREGTAYGDVVVFLAPAMTTEDAAVWAEPDALPDARPMVRTGTDWPERDFAAVVSSALAELKVPVWTFEAVARAWRAAVPGGDVVRHMGLWTGDGMRPVPTLIFRRGNVERTVALEDVYALDAAALVARVLADGAAWADAPEEEAVEPPPEPVAPAAQGQHPHPQKGGHKGKETRAR